MAHRLWPRPLRRALYWALLLVTTAIAFSPLTLLSQSLHSSGDASWLQLLGGYSTVITVPIVILVAAITADRTRESLPTFFLAYVMLGTFEGVFVGLVLSIVTGGFSLLSAPSVGYLTLAAYWLIRRPDRDGANPDTRTP